MPPLPFTDVLVQVKTILESKIVYAPVDDATPLVSGGVLDSLNVVNLVVELEGAFSITIGPDDMKNEHFETPTALAQLCSGKLGTGLAANEAATVSTAA